MYLQCTVLAFFLVGACTSCSLPQEIRGNWLRKPWGRMEVKARSYTERYDGISVSRNCLWQDEDRYLVVSGSSSPLCVTFDADGDDLTIETLLMFGTTDLRRLRTFWKRSCRSVTEPKYTRQFSKDSGERARCVFPEQMQGEWWRVPSGDLEVTRFWLQDSSFGNMRCLDQDEDRYLLVAHQRTSLCVTIEFENDGSMKIKLLQRLMSRLDDLETMWKASCRTASDVIWTETYNRPDR